MWILASGGGAAGCTGTWLGLSCCGLSVGFVLGVVFLCAVITAAEDLWALWSTTFWLCR